MLERETAPAQIRSRRIEPRQLHRKVAARCINQDLIPVDAHVSNNAHFTILAQEFPRKIYDYGLRPANGNSNVLNNRAPASVLVFHLKRRQGETLSTLR